LLECLHDRERRLGTPDMARALWDERGESATATAGSHVASIAGLANRCDSRRPAAEAVDQQALALQSPWLCLALHCPGRWTDPMRVFRPAPGPGPRARITSPGRTPLVAVSAGVSQRTAPGIPANGGAGRSRAPAVLQHRASSAPAARCSRRCLDRSA